MTIVRRSIPCLSLLQLTSSARGVNPIALIASTLSLIASPLHAAELNIGVSFSIPPYVIQENNSGLELEILQQALAVKGHSVSVHYLPLARTFHELKEGKLDGIINAKIGVVENVHYSEKVISFENCAISLEKNHYKIDAVSDLANKQVVAFQRASSLLGDEFKQMSESNNNYSEQARQLLQVYMLMKRRVDVIVMDKNIFKYYLKQAYLEGKLSVTELKQQAICHKIFQPTDYRFAFLNPDIRDDFNLGLIDIQNNGTLSQIHDKYHRLLSLDFEADASSYYTEPLTQEKKPF